MSTEATTQRKSRNPATAATTTATTTTTSTTDPSTISGPTSITGHLRRLLDRDQTWEKNDLLDAIYWLRQAVAVVLGVVLGLAGVTGGAGVVVAVVVLSVGVFGWYGKYQQVDVEEMGSWKLMSEGSFPAFALFIVSQQPRAHQASR